MMMMMTMMMNKKLVNLLSLCFLLFNFNRGSDALMGLRNCRNALGMQSGLISDKQITCSSTFDQYSLGANVARIRTEKNGGAWCPKDLIDDKSYEFIEIDLRQLHVLTSIETQGRYDNGKGKEWAEYYRIEYTRDRSFNNHTRWIRYKSRDGVEIIRGNDNTYMAEIREFNRIIIARRIRIIPVSKQKRSICMRVELYGCEYKDDILYYEMRDGDTYKDVKLQDKIYDGIHEPRHYLRKGHGSLTDGELGADSYRSERYGIRGYDWVGWRNDTRQSQLHQILFRFDNIRNFTMCTMYINNQPSQKIELYKFVRFKFSVDGVYFDDELNFTHNRDEKMIMPRPILVNLNNKIGRYVLIEFQFHNRFFVLSEITFESELVTVVASPPPPPSQDQSQMKQQQHQQQTHLDSENESQEMMDDDQNDNPMQLSYNVVTEPIGSSNQLTSQLANTQQHLTTNNLNLQSLVMIILSCILFIIVVLIGVSYCLMNHSSNKCFGKYKKTPTSSSCNSHHLTTSNKHNHGSDGSTTSTTTNSIDKQQTTKSNFNILVDTSETTYLYPSLKYKTFCLHESELASTLRQIQPPPLPVFNPNEIHYATSDLQKQQHNTLMKLATSTSTSTTNSTNLYYTIKPQVVSTTLNQNHLIAAKQQLLFKQHQLQQQQQEYISIRRIDANLLCFLEKIGESSVSNFYHGQINLNGGEINENVLIKVLKNEHDTAIKFGFDNDIDLSIINKNKNEQINIIKLLGICDNPYCYIIDSYTTKTNLYDYLTRKECTTPLGYSTLLSLCEQISNAMSYLESINQMHKDLSTKNLQIQISTNEMMSSECCTIRVKLCDFARYMYEYRDDYCVLLTNTQQSLRLRWSAWETICTGQFSIKSDVWSFAITLYELLTQCKNKPYNEYTDEELINQINTTINQYNFTQQQQQQQQPINNDALLASPNSPTATSTQCILNSSYIINLIDSKKQLDYKYTKEIIDLMSECLNINLNKRPKFYDINLFFKYKLNGSTNQQTICNVNTITNHVNT